MLFLGYESAVQYWRAVRAGLVPFPSEAQITVVSNEDHLVKEVRCSAPALPIDGQFQPDVLVSQTKLIHRSDEVRCHLCARGLPSGSFCRHTSDVVVASPELCLLQAAHSLGYEGAIALYELCCEFLGCYTLCEGNPRGFIECPPLTTRQRVIDFLDKLPNGTNGRKLLRFATERVGENSRSPRETECYLTMTLPTRCGGFNLPHPVMNSPILLKEAASTLSCDDYYLVDLFWEDRGVIFEYDGELDHSTSDRVARDKERRSVLASMGFTVVVGTKDSVSDDAALRRKMAQVFKALGIRMPSFQSEELAAQESLRRILFNPSHHLDSPFTTPIVPDFALVTDGYI